VHGDEGRLDELFLDLLVKALVERVAPGLFGLAEIDADRLGGLDGLLVGADRHKVDAQVLLHRLRHRQAAEAPCETDVVALPGDVGRSENGLGRAGEQILEQIHHVVEIGVGLVELDRGELRVVLGVHALVAEDAADLVHAVEPAHNEALEVQLRRDAEVHIDVERVVVRDKGSGRRAAGDGVEHRGLDLHIAAVVEELAQVLDELAADLKVAAHLGVDDQIDVALTVARLAVGQAMEFFRQRQKRLGQQRDLLRAHAHFTALRAEHLAVDADDVADVVFLKAVVGFLVHLVFSGVELDAAGLVLNVAE